jgi:hypothetical protein
MNTKYDLTATDSPAAAARIVATLLARDGRLDWREMEFLTRSDAFGLMGVSRQEFLAILARVLGERGARSVTRRRPVEPLLAAIRDRRLQFLVAALLVYVAEIDREVRPEESSLVRAAFDQWGITPADLAREMNVPLARSHDALGAGRQAA